MSDLCSLTASGLLTVDAALAQIKASLSALKNSEKIALQNALGRILSAPVIAAIDLPSDRNSAMDGYAFSSADIQSNQSFTLTLVGTSWAGRPFTGKLHAGECVRIFTGAVVPDAADSVIMQEQVSAVENVITFPANCRPFQNVREIGEDVKQHSLLLDAAKKLHAADLGLLAAAGISEIAVHSKVKIAIFSTGDELVPLGQKLESGQIYDSNRYILNGLLNDACFEVFDMGVLADDKLLVEQSLVIAAENMDVILTTGGASVGDADYIQQILTECGEVNFWKIAMKPGKPLAFGRIGKCTFFGLPGNPIAVMATFEKIVKPALMQLSGAAVQKPLRLKAVCESNLKKSAGRLEYQRGIFKQNEHNEFVVESAGQQGSHILSSMSRANCYIVLAQECNGVRIGEEVIVEPFEVFL
jgi:molybdopterin molybdotransferase